MRKKKKSTSVTIYDIANALGIAPSSVSKALNDSHSISNKIKELVKKKAQELNYRHNARAASLRGGKTNTVGVVVPKINSAFFSNAISGMEEICFAHNHQLIICQTEESYIKEKQAIETLIANNVDCIIISQSMETKTAHHLDEVVKHRIPLIQFDRVNQHIACHKVVNDNMNAAHQATTHLISQQYNRIAYLGGSFNMNVYEERKEGFLRAMREKGIIVPYDYIVEHVFTKETGYEFAMNLLKSPFPPQAFLTSSDHTAVGVISAIKDLGLSIPDDTGVIGFSNEPFSEMIHPSLTTVDQNSRMMGIETANIFFNDLGAKISDHGPISKTIPCTLIYRQSTRNG